MGRWGRIGIVIAGYMLAIAAGCLAGYLYDRRMAAMPYDTSGGMYAGGQMLTVLAAFLAVALVPTLLVLWFLRDNQTFWWWIAFASFGFASVGLIAVLSPLWIHEPPRNLGRVFLDLVGLGQLFGMPLWTAGFAVMTLLAPTRRIRRVLVAAIGLELVTGVCVAIHWLVPYSPL
jgi:hypothetical protein